MIARTLAGYLAAVACAAAISASVGLVLREKREALAASATESVAAGLVVPAADEGAPLAPLTPTRESRTATREPRTVRQLLVEFWGRPWEALSPWLDLAHSTEAELDTDAALAAWSDVEPVVRRGLTAIDDGFRSQQVERALDWNELGREPDFAARQFNPTGKLIGDRDREELSRLVHRGDAELTACAIRASELIGEALLDRWNRGAYVRSPFVRPLDASDSPPNKRGRYAQTATNVVGGWITDLDFDSADYPEVDREFARIEELKRERLRGVLDYIARLP